MPGAWYGDQGQMATGRPDQMGRAPPVAELLVRVDGRSATPLHAQIFDGVRAAILRGTLAAGARLPSSRELAAQLGVARTTVLQALEGLVAEGYVVARPRSGLRVAPQIPSELV